jgi:capsular exopolysaccharide synthesis family protein
VELKHYFDILKRHSLVIILVMAVTMIVVVTYSLLAAPIYTAKTTARVSLDVGISELYFFQREENLLRLLNTYQRVLQSKPFEDQVINQLEGQFGARVGEGLHTIKADPIPDSELIDIQVEHEDPVIAREMANGLATMLIQYVREIENSQPQLQIVDDQLRQLVNNLDTMRQQLTELTQTGGSAVDIEALRNQIKLQEETYNRLLENYQLARLKENLTANSISILQPAMTPEQASNALGLKEIGLALVIGLMGGIALSLVLENLDTRFQSIEQLEHVTHIPIIGIVPGGLLSTDNGSKYNGALEEAYRQLAMNLQAQTQTKGGSTFLITSAIPREGKSTVASNLATVLAEQAKTIFLIEGDMRHPTYSDLYGIKNGSGGLSGYLAGLSPLDTSIHTTDQPSLFVVTSGPTPPNPTALLASPAMENMLSYLMRQAQITLVDAPPVLGVADVSVLAPHVDGLILVVNQAISRREQVLEALKQLEVIKAQVLGIIFLRSKNGSW